MTRIKTFKFYTGLILCIILIPILLMNLAIIIKGVIVPNEVPQIFGTIPMVVVTDSMNTERSNIAGGDMIFAKETNPANLEVDDIILFKHGKSLVLHRIAEIEETNEGRSLTTRGDANNANDTEPILESQVVGVYQFRIPQIGHFILFMKTAPGMLLCIGVPLVVFLGLEIREKNQDAKKKEREIAELRQKISENSGNK